jgi:N-acetylneuraminic acid mutarotase
MYDPTTNTWVSKKEMPSSRMNHECVVLEDKIYAIGGINDNGSVVYDINEVYDPKINSWGASTEMPGGLQMFGATLCNNKIYAIGGGTTSPSYLTTVYEMNPNFFYIHRKN